MEEDFLFMCAPRFLLSCFFLEVNRGKRLFDYGGRGRQTITQDKEATALSAQLWFGLLLQRVSRVVQVDQSGGGLTAGISANRRT